MLVDVTGNILDSSMQTLACPVNAVGVMGAGLALAFKRRYPEVDYQYRRLCREHAGVIGDQLHVVQTRCRKHQVLLFPTKYHWRNRSTLTQLEANLQRLVLQYETLGITSLAIPALGCGLGGLDYVSQVRPLLQQYLSELPFPVELYMP